MLKDTFTTSFLDLIKKAYAEKTPTPGLADSLDVYKHKNGLDTAKSYSDAINSLFSKSKSSLSTYGENSRQINNKGLQNSGYADYIDAKAKSSFDYGKAALEDSYHRSNEDTLSSYASYLEKYQDKQNSTKSRVLSHLIDNSILDISTAIAYGINAGLSFDDAKAVGESAYQTSKNKIANDILKQSVSLGLDQAGAKRLAISMGLSSRDADEIAKEVANMLEYYNNISADYLAFLEERSG